MNPEDAVQALQRGGPFTQAISDLQLTRPEQNLYWHHLTNLAGPGKVVRDNGDISTVYQAGVGHNGQQYNIPTIWGGRELPVPEAVNKVKQQGWGNFPSYPTSEAAEQRYGKMHDYMEQDVQNYIKALQKK